MTTKSFRWLFALAALLRFAFIWDAPLWYDENFSYALSKLTLPRMMLATMGDVHPPLYYLLIWPLGQIDGLPSWALRIPSAILSLAALWLFWLVLKRLRVNDRVQVIALALMTVLPLQLNYAQEARMYSLLEAEVLLALYAMLARRWSLLGLASAAMLYTQNYALFYLPCIWLVGVVRHHHSDRPHFTFALFLAGVTWLPWLGVLFQQMGVIGGNYWIFDASAGAGLYSLYQLFWAFAIPDAVQVAVMFVTFLWLFGGAAWFVDQIVQMHGAMRRFVKRSEVWHMSLTMNRVFLIVLLMAFGPLLLAMLVSFAWQPVLLFRPLIGISPFLILLCAYPLVNLKTRRAQLAAAIFILPMFLLGLPGFYLKSSAQKGGDSKEVALTYILDHWQAGDVIYHSGDASLVNWMPYSPQLTHVIRADCDQRPYGALSQRSRNALGIPSLPLSEVHYRRAWVVYSRTPLIPNCEAEYMASILGDADPVYVITDDRFVYAGVWLVEGPWAQGAK